MADLIEPRRVAAIEERRLAVGVGEVVEDAEAWCGGVMCFGGEGSWSNQTMGACMDGEVATADDVAKLAVWYEQRGAEPKVMTCPFADGSLVRELGEAGFRLKEFETIFVCGLEGRVGDGWKKPAEIELEIVDASEAEAVEAYVYITNKAFVEGEPAEAMLQSSRNMMRHPRVVCLLARIDGEIVGGGALETYGELASLIGAGVSEKHRRRGVQRTLIEARLEMGLERGCTMMTVGTLPGIATERNAMRSGFLPSYTRVAMVRPGEGLVVSP